MIGMTDNAISELYYALKDEYIASINPDGEQAIEKERDRIEQEIIKTIGENKTSEIDSFIGEGYFAFEHYGFVTGFKYAMRLLTASGVYGKEQNNEQPINGTAPMYSSNEQ